MLARRPKDPDDKVYIPYSVLKDFEPDLTMALSQLARTSPAAVDVAAQAAHVPKCSKGLSLRALYVRGTATCGASSHKQSTAPQHRARCRRLVLGHVHQQLVQQQQRPQHSPLTPRQARTRTLTTST